MFNVTIINAKKSLIRISIFIATITIVFCTTKFVNKFKTSEILQINISQELVRCLNYEIPAIESVFYQSNNQIKEDGDEEKKDTFVATSTISVCCSF